MFKQNVKTNTFDQTSLYFGGKKIVMLFRSVGAWGEPWATFNTTTDREIVQAIQCPWFTLVEYLPLP